MYPGRFKQRCKYQETPGEVLGDFEKNHFIGLKIY